MIGLAAALALAASQAGTAPAGYPVAEMLAAFGSVCFDPATLQQDNPENPATWKKLAAEQGWAEIGARPDASDSRSRRAYDWAKALDSELLASIDPYGPVQLREAALFQRQVAGRAVYLSIAAMDSENPKLAECRLRDPLGDGIRKSPITRAAIEKWLGHSVKPMPAWYRGKQYWWPNGNNRLSVRVHFGFEQRRLGVVGARYDPYALYGLTLVRSDYDEIIVV
jgi:hypothetical protein